MQQLKGLGAGGEGGAGAAGILEAEDVEEVRLLTQAVSLAMTRVDVGLPVFECVIINSTNVREVGTVDYCSNVQLTLSSHSGCSPCCTDSQQHTHNLHWHTLHLHLA